MYAKVRAELGDNESLLKTYQKSHDELGRKYEDALLKMDNLSTNPNFSGKVLDKLHNEISKGMKWSIDFSNEVDAQREEIDYVGKDAGRAVSQSNDRRLAIKGATDFSIPESHLTEMHTLVSERYTEMEEMSKTKSTLKLENMAASSEMNQMKLKICGISGNAVTEMKQEKNEEVRRLKDELQKMEERKNHFKNNFSQAEDRANDEEQEYRAEAEAFEKLRNEYNLNVKELEILERDSSKSTVSLREAEKINLQPWPKTTELSAWKGGVVLEVCVASGDRDFDEWKAWLAPCLVDQPDLDMLAKAPERRFQSTGAKLSHALRKVTDNAGDKSMQVKYDMSMKNQLHGKSGDFIKGRELFAIVG